MRSPHLLVLLPILIATTAHPQKATQDPFPPQAHRQGAFTATFTERSRHSHRSKIQNRLFRERLTQKHPDYELADESFHVIVPETYTPDVPHGLLVWVSPLDHGRPAPAWIDELAKRKLIWIGANHAGNEREIWQRLSLPLDAVHNMTRLYTIDDQRVYVSGVSGGGRSASRLGVGMADVFDGAMPIVGCDFYERIEAPDHPGGFYRAFRKPGSKLLSHAKKNLRLVIMTGEKDYNRDQCRLFYEQYRFHSFRHAAYLEVPGMEHVYPDAEWFAKGLDMLDAPLHRANRHQDGGGSKPAPTPGTSPTEQPDEPPARQKLELAMNYYTAGADAAARREFRSIIDEHPDSKEAQTAQRFLAKLEDQ